ncbi:hypothetical protein [Streptomyces sp. NPDC002602]|uniref:hypothetical protein n=1 Tax=Streptomyces sp. NPDC002602 TaxID=3364654 RepID=UPI0036B2E9E6
MFREGPGVCREYAYPGRAEIRARVETLLMGWWAALLEVGDTNGDGPIDMGELLATADG